MQTATAHHSTAAYRAASLRQVVLQRLKQKLALVWRVMEAYGNRRAAQHMQMMGVTFEPRRP
ncbi:MAG TPA: hypothetical protein VLA61_06170 [Ideonella sp.]|uniref:hypothetical protein n=1 Tax=Ideonella sp. TaxID=1929293 RepID=UPI002C9B3A71|nr:hypothetical protein [Ideonella sp.]HSI47834.1 hypothetical protein [Ideonella sp.]